MPTQTYANVSTPRSTAYESQPPISKVRELSTYGALMQANQRLLNICDTAVALRSRIEGPNHEQRELMRKELDDICEIAQKEESVTAMLEWQMRIIAYIDEHVGQSNVRLY